MTHCPLVRKGALLLTAMLTLQAPALRADEVHEVYLNPQIGGVIPDSKWQLKNDVLWGIGAGLSLSQNWNGELNFNDASLSRKRLPGHATPKALSLDVLRVFGRERTVAPYLSLGMGVVDGFHGNNANTGSSDFLAQLGAGLMIKLWESSDGSSRFSLRPDIKVRYDDDSNISHSLFDYIGTLGFQFGFGGPRAPAVAAAAAPPPPPPPTPPPPAPVVALPAPPPPPPPPAPQPRTVILRGVEFEFNSATLTAASKPVLDQVAEGLREHPRLRIEVQGHTDGVGPPEYNLTLSQRRALAVRDYLIGQQVPAEELVARGYGKTQPIASNATAAGRAMNRRVVLAVLDNPGAVPVEGAGRAATE